MIDNDAIVFEETGVSLSWATAPEAWTFAVPNAITPRVTDEGVGTAETKELRVHSGPCTDLLVGAPARPARLTAPRAITVCPSGDFQFIVHVSLEAATKFDGAGLVIWANDSNWAKLCIEMAPDGSLAVVSVVTRDISDDASAFSSPGRQIWLRVSRVAGSLTFHASFDGQLWHFVRHFVLSGQAPLLRYVGVFAQSPDGEGCVATFAHVTLDSRTLVDRRSGV